MLRQSRTAEVSTSLPPPRGEGSEACERSELAELGGGSRSRRGWRVAPPPGSLRHRARPLAPQTPRIPPASASRARIYPRPLPGPYISSASPQRADARRTSRGGCRRPRESSRGGLNAWAEPSTRVARERSDSPPAAWRGASSHKRRLPAWTIASRRAAPSGAGLGADPGHRRRPRALRDRRSWGGGAGGWSRCPRRAPRCR